MAERLSAEALSDLLAKGGSVLLDFYSDSCLPCKRMSPLLAQLEEQYPAVQFGRINVAHEKELAEQYGVKTVPTLVYIRNGQEAARTSGVQTRTAMETQLKELLQESK